MNRLRRMLVSFCIMLNLAGFGLLFLVLANGSTVGDVVLIAGNDAVLLFVASLFGLLFNLILAVALWRGGVRTRRLEAELRRERSAVPG
ncbi:MAG TPA: hypothetical protein VGR08_13105 [Thermomicrobiales bacterium]|nr:hypothetical protein [Thermomicrobiales bacterium]